MLLDICMYYKCKLQLDNIFENCDNTDKVDISSDMFH
jgi:hypothetical protein